MMDIKIVFMERQDFDKYSICAGDTGTMPSDIPGECGFLVAYDDRQRRPWLVLPDEIEIIDSLERGEY